MKNLKIFLVLTLFFIPFAVASFAYDNPSLPKLTPPEIRTQAVNNNSINVNNSNCWQNDCSGFRNPFNQWLNTSNSPSFTGGYFGGLITSNVDAFTLWHQYTAIGGAFPIGRVTAENLVFQIMPENGFDLYMGNFSTSTFLAGNTNGRSSIFSAVTTVIETLGGGRTFESNSTKTQIYTNSTFSGTNNSFTNNVFIAQNTTIKGLTHDWAVANGLINATGVNITSNHQIYNVSTSLDTTYTNQNQRPIHLISSIQISASPSDIGAVQAYVNGNLTQIIGLDLSSASFESIGTILELSTYVPPNGVYSLNTTISGSAFILMKGSRITVI